MVGGSRDFQGVGDYAAIAQPVLNTSGWVYISLNRTDRMLRWGLFAVPLLLTSFVIGLPWGPNGVAIMYAICSSLLILPCLLFMVRGTSLSVRGVLLAVWRPAVISVFIYITIALARQAVLDRPPMVIVLASLLARWAS